MPGTCAVVMLWSWLYPEHAGSDSPPRQAGSSAAGGPGSVFPDEQAALQLVSQGSLQTILCPAMARMHTVTVLSS